MLYTQLLHTQLLQLQCSLNVQVINKLQVASLSLLDVRNVQVESVSDQDDGGHGGHKHQSACNLPLAVSLVVDALRAGNGRECYGDSMLTLVLQVSEAEWWGGEVQA